MDHGAAPGFGIVAEGKRKSKLAARSRSIMCATGVPMGGASGGGPAELGKRWPSVVASLAVGATFFALWFWLLPGWLGFRVETAGVARWQWLAAVPSVLGFAVAIRCVWDFGSTGRGTPAPIAPPRRLVVAGFYRYVRNPMYVGFAAGWTGLWVVFGQANPRVIAAVAAVALGVHLFVVFYEEPTLRNKFGAEYEDYRRNVRRWWPRLRAWQ
jgi:protein-S-isoprenylcysteine O-methyltransferase Ste14